MYGANSALISTLTSDSRIEEAILRSNEPINVNETEETMALGHRGVWVNRSEVLNWRGPVPINEYKLNDDPNPEVINKTVNQPVEYNQEVQVKYLRPPTPPPPGELIIRSAVRYFFYILNIMVASLTKTTSSHEFSYF